MPFQRVIYHVGPAKTGTSSIQSFCDSNRYGLWKELGIYYPPTTHCVSHHNDLARWLGSVNGQSTGGSWLDPSNRKFTHMQESSVLYSGEAFAGLINDDAAMQSLHRFAGYQGSSIQIIFVWREAASQAISELQQQLSSASDREGLILLSEFMSGNRLGRSSDRALRCYCQHFGSDNIIVLRYKDNILQPFLKTLAGQCRISDELLGPAGMFRQINQSHSRDHLLRRKIEGWLAKLERCSDQVKSEATDEWIGPLSASLAYGTSISQAIYSVLKPSHLRRYASRDEATAYLIKEQGLLCVE